MNPLVQAGFLDFVQFGFTSGQGLFLATFRTIIRAALGFGFLQGRFVNDVYPWESEIGSSSTVILVWVSITGTRGSTGTDHRHGVRDGSRRGVCGSCCPVWVFTWIACDHGLQTPQRSSSRASRSNPTCRSLCTRRRADRGVALATLKHLLKSRFPMSRWRSSRTATIIRM